MEDTGLPHAAETPPDANDIALPDTLSATTTGLWVHADDLCLESATPLQGFRPHAVFAGLDTGILQGEQVSTPRRAHLEASVRDGLARAGQHFGTPTRYEDALLPEALADWAGNHGLRDVVALRPAVGPLLDLAPSVRARLAKAGIGLHLIWRPEDVATLPHARAGYFAFWQGVREDMLGDGANGTDDQTQRAQRRPSSGHSHRRQRQG